MLGTRDDGAGWNTRVAMCLSPSPEHLASTARLAQKAWPRSLAADEPGLYP